MEGKGRLKIKFTMEDFRKVEQQINQWKHKVKLQLKLENKLSEIKKL